MKNNKDVLIFFQRSLDYIEENLTENIRLESIAASACMSLSAYYVLFKAFTFRTLKAYIRQRRLTLAGYDLIHTNETILDIASKYQYESYEAFSRAFKTQHGVSPKGYRLQNIFVETFPKIKLIEVEDLGGQVMVTHEMNRDQIVRTMEKSKKGFILDIDIDRFMAVNASYGREGGDAVLIEVPKRIKTFLKNQGISKEVVRFGSDEFIVVVEETEIENVHDLANGIVLLFQAPIAYGKQDIKITVTVGIRAFTQNGQANLMIDKVNATMLKAKQTGRNQYYME